MDTGLFEDEVLSMVDVLHENNELEEEARAVLGDSDDQHCTYPAVSYFKASCSGLNHKIITVFKLISLI